MRTTRAPLRRKTLSDALFLIFPQGKVDQSPARPSGRSIGRRADASDAKSMVNAELGRRGGESFTQRRRASSLQPSAPAAMQFIVGAAFANVTQRA